jgi:hypothetical protein
VVVYYNANVFSGVLALTVTLMACLIADHYHVPFAYVPVKLLGTIFMIRD